jgi:hypothetical protein
MKIVMQHGHAVSKREIESFLKLAPQSWSKAYDSIVVYSSNNEPPKIRFHPKEKTLGIHISEKSSKNAAEVIEEIAVASQAIQEHGHWPINLARQKDLKYRERWLAKRG